MSNTVPWAIQPCEVGPSHVCGKTREFSLGHVPLPGFLFREGLKRKNTSVCGFLCSQEQGRRVNFLPDCFLHVTFVSLVTV